MKSYLSAILPYFLVSLPGFRSFRESIQIELKIFLLLPGWCLSHEGLDLKQMHFVMDKGFYSEKRIGPLLEKYIDSVPFTTKAAKKTVENSMGHICVPRNAIDVDDLLCIYATFKNEGAVGYTIMFISTGTVN